jgi:ABC-type bacteriocin/lantibiotic exporter with double-glycine peptidase domain
MNNIDIIKPFIIDNKYLLITYLLFTILTYPLETIIIPNIFGDFFSNIKENIDNGSYKIFLLKSIFFLLIINIANSTISYMDSIIMPKFNQFFVNLIYKKILLNYENSYTDLELGKIVSRLNSLPTIVRELTGDFINWLLPRLITIIIVNIYLLSVNTYIGILSIILLIISIVYNYINLSTFTDITHKKYVEYENRAEETQDKLSNLFAIYSNGTINNEIKSYNKYTKKYKNAHKDMLIFSSKIKFTNNLIECIGVILFNILIIYLYKHNKISFSQIISLNLIKSYYNKCISTILFSLPDYIGSIGILKSLKDFFNILNIEKEQKNIIQINSGDISIKNLSFSYNNNNIFNNFNLNIKDGEKIGLTGESGNGKSTLIKLIMGYYKVDDNSIFIDGIDINKYNLDSLRKQIIYINQNTKLFNKTIYYNIKYGNKLTNEKIDYYIKKYNINSVFKNLKNGLNTLVGVNGDNLSGGQKQIIQIIRAFGKNCKIIILDEPTASLDVNSRNIVLKMITDLTKNSTLILITHDKENLQIVNRKIYLSHGKIKSDKYIS